MISYKLATQLKKAGLQWKPKLGDVFVSDYSNSLGPTPPANV